MNTKPKAGISIDEIADELGVHRTTLYEQVRMNALPWPFVRIGRRVVVSRRAFESWLNGSVLTDSIAELERKLR